MGFHSIAWRFAKIFTAVTLLCVAGGQGRAEGTLNQQLAHAVIQDHARQAADLLARGADPNARTPLAAEDRWFPDNRPDMDPIQPIVVLACRFASIQGTGLIQSLLDRGANVNLADRNGVTPLMVSSELGSYVSLLLERGANVSAKDNNDRTALHYAMNNRGLNTAAALLRKGADVNARDKDGATPLMIALRQSSRDPIRLIVPQGQAREILAQREAQAKERYVELIRFLIERGANVNARNKAGETLLAIAEQIHQPDAVSLLRHAGAMN